MRTIENRSRTPIRSALVLAVASLGGGCASGGAPDADAGPRATAARAVQQCKVGDTRVDGEADCLRDDAACYPLASGGFCTGERGNTCPAGSAALPTGTPCPPGTRCFRLGESLECAVTLG